MKFANDNNVPNNITDRTYNLDIEDDSSHTEAAARFLEFHNMADNHGLFPIGHTLTKRGFVFEVISL